MLSREIDSDRFSMTFINREGDRIRVNPCEGFDMELNLGGITRRLHGCYATVTETNEPSFPYEVSSLSGERFNIPRCDCPNYSMDIYPSYFTTEFEPEKKEVKEEVVKETEPEVVKETTNVVEPEVIYNTWEKLRSNVEEEIRL